MGNNIINTIAKDKNTFIKLFIQEFLSEFHLIIINKKTNIE